MVKSCYTKIGISVFDYGVTIPKDYEKIFKAGRPLKLGAQRDIKIKLGKKVYDAKLAHTRRTRPVFQIRYDSNHELKRILRKKFVHSYIILKSKKELFELDKRGKKHFRSKLEHEVLEIISHGPTLIEFKGFIRITDEWDTLFQRLVDENVFDMLFDKKDKQYLIQHSEPWRSVNEFDKHKFKLNVIYYLANTKTKEIYIGKAKELGKRVTPGRKHQEMSGEWNKFRYDIIRPEFANILERVEDHTIRTFAAILHNNSNYPSLKISNYSLVNKGWKKL